MDHRSNFESICFFTMSFKISPSIGRPCLLCFRSVRLFMIIDFTRLRDIYTHALSLKIIVPMIYVYCIMYWLLCEFLSPSYPWKCQETGIKWNRFQNTVMPVYLCYWINYCTKRGMLSCASTDGMNINITSHLDNIRNLFGCHKCRPFFSVFLRACSRHPCHKQFMSS